MSQSSSPNGTNKLFATVVHGPMWENPYGLHVGPIWVLWATRKGYMVLDVRTPVFRGGGGGVRGCKQQRRRPASASALSDQPLCCSLFVKYHS